MLMRKVTIALSLAIAGAPAFGQEPRPALFDEESIFDRVETVFPETLDVPFVERREVSLGIDGEMVDVGDAELYVARVGREDGVPVVAITGGPGTSHHYFHGYMDRLEAMAPVIYFDQRGVGLSDYKRPEGGYTIMQDVEDLEALRTALGIDRWVLLGYSFGGLTAALYSTQYPEATAGVILMSSIAPFDIDVGLGERQFGYMTQAERDRVLDFYSVNGKPAVPAHTDDISAELQMVKVYNGYKNGDWKRRWMYKPPEEKFALFARYEWRHDKNYYAEMIADGDRYDLRGVFNISPIPMLIAEGEWDVSFGKQKAGVMASQFPNADLVYSRHAGHRIFQDDPDLFYAAVGEFLNQDFEIDADALNDWKHQLQFMSGMYNPD
ncbi:MAG: alpha/beta hydrolase [Pseudomonadota bacterium]